MYKKLNEGVIEKRMSLPVDLYIQLLWSSTKPIHEPQQMEIWMCSVWVTSSMKYPHAAPIGKFAFVFYYRPITGRDFKIKTGTPIVENY